MEENAMKMFLTHYYSFNIYGATISVEHLSSTKTVPLTPSAGIISSDIYFLQGKFHLSTKATFELYKQDRTNITVNSTFSKAGVKS